MKRADLKCGRGAISPGEKCTKGKATKAKNSGHPRDNFYGTGLRMRGNGTLGSRYGGGLAGKVKAVGLGALETVKWTSGYNVGKNLVGQENAKKQWGTTKALGIASTTLLLGPQAGLGAARRYGVFGETDLERNKKNYFKGDSIWADGFHP